LSLPGMVDSAVSQFTQLDTRDQRKVLRRVGEDTETADRLLGALAGNYPDRYRALCILMGYEPGQAAA
jgi:hypothetical protein